MQIWLDTVNIDLVKDASGIISGVTTNPSILSHTSDIPKTFKNLLTVQSGPIAVQVTSAETPSMIEEGRQIYAFSERMIIKVPVNPPGLAAMKQLVNENIPVLGTAVFHPAQALLAANIGASYVAPYYSHIGEHAAQVLTTIAALLRNRQTKLMAASVKSLEDIITCALIGVVAITIKDDLFIKLINTTGPLDQFLQKFTADWQQTHGQNSIKQLLNS